MIIFSRISVIVNFLVYLVCMCFFLFFLSFFFCLLFLMILECYSFHFMHHYCHLIFVYWENARLRCYPLLNYLRIIVNICSVLDSHFLKRYFWNCEIVRKYYTEIWSSKMKLFLPALWQDENILSGLKIEIICFLFLYLTFCRLVVHLFWNLLKANNAVFF